MMTDNMHGGLPPGRPVPSTDQPGDGHLATGPDDLDTLDTLRDLNPDLGPDQDGRTPLHVSAQEGQLDTVKLLIGRGFMLDPRDAMGYTPLLRSASQGHHDVAEVLLENGCDVNAQDDHGNAAIHEACWNGFSKTAELLVKYDCDVFLVNKAGFTALHLAAQNGHNESSRVLLYAGCNPDLKNNYGDTALHTAARYGHAGVARILISARCKLNEQNKNGDTALHISAALKRRKIAKILMESGINPDLLNKQDERAIDVARRKEHPEIELIITTCVKPCTPSSHRRQHGESFNVTFKDDIEFDDGPVVCPEDQPPLKPEPKQEKERKFFFFRKKKKDKEKEKPKSSPAATDVKKPIDVSQHALHNRHQTKSPVTGFFSQYIPRDGVQLYRDLAGNIKQGPIGYAPVCQCGPSLKRLETSIEDTRESLYNHIDTSHQVLAQRIENLDIRTTQQAYATNAILQEHIHHERDACHARISERLQGERINTHAYVDQMNTEMADKLDFWLNDKLASYGHCLDHHHDDSALPPRNLFSDFPTMGRLVRSRSDETLSASDYSGKHRKKDFYASRKAAMQQIRGWDVPNVDKSKGKVRLDGGKHRERNNNNATWANGNNRVVVEAQVHVDDSAHRRDMNSNPKKQEVLSPSTNSTTSPGTLSSHQNLRSPSQDFLRQSARGQDTPHRDVQHGIMGDARQTHYNRVHFSSDLRHPQQQQQQQHLYHPPHQQHQHHLSSQHPSHTSSSPQPHGVPFDPTRHPAWLSSRNTPESSQYYPQSQQNLSAGGPPKDVTKSGEQGGSLRPPLDTGLSSYSSNRPNSADSTVAHTGTPPRQLARQQDNYGVQYLRARTFSTDSVLDPEMSDFQYMARSRSVENTLDDSGPVLINTPHSSGYATDSALRPSTQYRPNRQAHNFRSVRETHSASPAGRATRYRLPETSGGYPVRPANPPPYRNSAYAGRVGSQPGLNFDPSVKGQSDQNISENGIQFTPRDYSPLSQKPPPRGSMQAINNSRGNNRNSYGNNSKVPYNPVCKSDPNLLSSPSPQPNGLPLSSECLQHSRTIVSTRATPSPAFATVGNKEDSTCSSNQDSGYGSRNRGPHDQGGVDTSGGTPSSSFSMERSACNTPSNGGSSYGNHNELITELRQSLSTPQQQQLRNFRGSPAYRYDSPDYNNSQGYQRPSSRPGSSDRSVRSNDSGGGPSYTPNSKLNGNVHTPQRPTSFSNAAQNNRPVPSSGGSNDQTLHNASSNSFRNQTPQYSKYTPQTTTFHPSSKQQKYQGSYTYQPSLYQTNVSYTPTTPSSNNTNQNINSHPGDHSSTPGPDTTTSSQQTKDSVPVNTSTVQAHIQGWYQKKLMEAAKRLRDSYLYNNPSPTEETDHPDGAFTYPISTQQNNNTPTDQRNLNGNSPYTSNQGYTHPYDRQARPQSNYEDYSFSNGSRNNNNQYNGQSQNNSYHPNTVSNLRERFENGSVRVNNGSTSKSLEQFNGHSNQRSSYSSSVEDQTVNSAYPYSNEPREYPPQHPNDNLYFSPQRTNGYHFDPVRGSDV